MRSRAINSVLLLSASSTWTRRSRHSLKTREIYTEAKGQGFDVKILREVIESGSRTRREREEEDSLRHVYLQAIATATPKMAKAA